MYKKCIFFGFVFYICIKQLKQAIMKNYINYILEALTLIGFFTTFYLLTLIFG